MANEGALQKMSKPLLLSAAFHKVLHKRDKVRKEMDKCTTKRCLLL